MLFKAFNTTGFGNMQNPDFPQGKAAMFVAGPDGKGKQTAMQLVKDVGFEAVDAGDLPSARLLEPLAMLWIKLAFAQARPRLRLPAGAARLVASRILALDIIPS